MRERPARCFARCIELVAIVPFLATGCFAHVPVDVEAVPRDAEVVVHVSGGTFQRLSLEAGYTVRSLTGFIESLQSDSLRLSVWAGRRYHGVTIDSGRRLHAIPLSEVVAVERRRLDPTRTALIGAGILAGIVLLIDQARGGGGGSQPPRPDPQPTPATVRR